MKRLRAWLRLFPSRPEPTRPGRPVGSGYWMSREDFIQAVTAAAEELAINGRRPTQAAVSRILCCDPRTLSRYLRDYRVNWEEIKKRSVSKL